MIITVVAINFIWKDDKSNDKELNDKENIKLVSSSEERSKTNTLEKRLEDILSNINGVGNVKVLITYNETEEFVPIYNKNDKKSTTNEIDSSGGTRIIEELDTSQEVVFENDKAITSKSISPKIEGAIITASGAGNSLVKTNIVQAVEAATGLATHKIQVFEMK